MKSEIFILNALHVNTAHTLDVISDTRTYGSVIARGFGCFEDTKAVSSVVTVSVGTPVVLAHR